MVLRCHHRYINLSLNSALDRLVIHISEERPEKKKACGFLGLENISLATPPHPLSASFCSSLSLSLLPLSHSSYIFSFLAITLYFCPYFSLTPAILSNKGGRQGRGGERGEGERSREEEREERERGKVRERGREEGEMNASSYNLSQLILGAFHPKPPYFPSQNEDKKAVPQWLRTWTHVREVCWFESSVGPLPLASV